MKHYENCLWSKGDFLATESKIFREGDDDDITIKSERLQKCCVQNFMRLVEYVCKEKKVMQMLRTELNIKLFSQCRAHTLSE